MRTSSNRIGVKCYACEDANAVPRYQNKFCSLACLLSHAYDPVLWCREHQAWDDETGQHPGWCSKARNKDDVCRFYNPLTQKREGPSFNKPFSGCCKRCKRPFTIDDVLALGARTDGESLCLSCTRV